MSSSIRRVAMLSAHTSPLDQPGTGDAGGMNVYVIELAKRLARRSIEVEVFTRATSRHLDPVVEVESGIKVHHVAAGPFDGLTKNELPAQMCSFVRDVLRVEALADPGYFDLVHSHYWLSGQVGMVAAERWSVPLVHSMHTMAKVKNAMLADGDIPEPVARERGEEEIVRHADRLVANTHEERHELIEYYAADPAKVRVVHPGVDLRLFTVDPSVQVEPLIVFAGRIQPLKAPDIVIKAAARLMADVPGLRVAIVGGASGSGLERPTELTDLTHALGIADRVEFVPTVTQSELAGWFRRASVVCVPSYNESFGLVALEAQACGTPVVAARVGGLSTAVADGVSGVLIDGHDPRDFADAMRGFLLDVEHRKATSIKAVTHASGFGWTATADHMIGVYEEARHG